MVGGTSRSLRKIHVVGTKGEIYGNFEDSKFYVSKINPSSDAYNGECDIEEVDVNVSGDMVGAYGGHGDGDERLGDAVPTEKWVPHGALGAVKKKSCILS